ncbi:hypothetical protein TNCV_2214801 [Trichonephila clavipes]|nr:hypothetical protein TNCV_2214801 [Trichonephila clavipes]
MDETATRSDVASTKVGDMFTTDTFYFDAVRANTNLDKCKLCTECEKLCDALEDILDTLHKPENNTPERLREFTDYIKEIERLNTVNVPTVTAASKTAKRRKNKRATGAPTPGNVGKKKCSECSLPPNTLSPPDEGETLSMEEDTSSDDSSEETNTTKVVSLAGRRHSIPHESLIILFSTNQRKMTDNMEMNPAMELDNELVNGMDNNTEQQPTGTETEQPLPQDDSRPELHTSPTANGDDYSPGI